MSKLCLALLLSVSSLVWASTLACCATSSSGFTPGDVEVHVELAGEWFMPGESTAVSIWWSGVVAAGATGEVRVAWDPPGGAYVGSFTLPVGSLRQISIDLPTGPGPHILKADLWEQGATQACATASTTVSVGGCVLITPEYSLDDSSVPDYPLGDGPVNLLIGTNIPKQHIKYIGFLWLNGNDYQCPRKLMLPDPLPVSGLPGEPIQSMPVIYYVIGESPSVVADGPYPSKLAYSWDHSPDGDFPPQTRGIHRLRGCVITNDDRVFLTIEFYITITDMHAPAIVEQGYSS